MNGYENTLTQSMADSYGITRLYVDMDGTLAVFNKVDELETLFEKGYFENLTPNEGVVKAVKLIIQNCPDVEVNVLSSYLTDSEYALAEKNNWLDRYLPEIDREHRIFVPCGDDKKAYVENHNQDCFLLDDYTKNLMQWEPPGRGIKLLNGINHTKGTWKKACVTHDDPPSIIASKIMGSIDQCVCQSIEPNTQAIKPIKPKR